MIREHNKSKSPPGATSHRLIQITDPHIGSRPDYQLLGLDTGHTLDEVLATVIAKQPRAQALVATGDISANGSEASYCRFLQKIRTIPIPWYWLPGNHDVSARMRQLAPNRSTDLIALGNWRLLLLDTSVEGQICGGLGEAQLERLQLLLWETREHPVMIMMHHQPVPVGSKWIDGHMLRAGRDQLLQMVDQAPQVKALVWGHVHQQFDSNRGQIGLHATPSTSVQFTPGSGPFAVDDEMPGYRWFELHNDGTYTTGVERVAISKYYVDLASSGY
ncbi:3',5'-cyclic adenosine monophosphate phosphodiesterase CpdA [Microbulbifer sp. NBRC 101763]|uniref:3',5'-cyclic-AMP phosphodiesterase n=1 Tax=Microbulbifer TaxID=48073 RepID=UPI001FE05B46|nr:MULTISPECIES: 3',5'-cyclic-AMP phosphodiesterase [Microbulbifer]WHI51650.1 3',5'-cyclic-AMP phosphodiesterase [Microbulbifer sp. MLAF003]